MFNIIFLVLSLGAVAALIIFNYQANYKRIQKRQLKKVWRRYQKEKAFSE